MSRIPVVLVLLAACGGESSPVEKCDDLVDLTCDRAVECVPSGGTHAQCVQEIQQVLPCGAAQGVSGTYGRCMDQLDSFSCAVLFPPDPDTGAPSLELPADCNGVILQRTAPDVSEWSPFVGEVSTQSME